MSENKIGLLNKKKTTESSVVIKPEKSVKQEKTFPKGEQPKNKNKIVYKTINVPVELHRKIEMLSTLTSQKIYELVAEGFEEALANQPEHIRNMIASLDK